VAAGLALTGKTTSAIILVVVGVAVISTIDNLARPIFSRYGKLEMPAFLILIAVFGGLAIFGTWGLFFGPLAVRMAMEALSIGREQRVTGAVLHPQEIADRDSERPTE
jgi:predicted PurR-regulated permease PerM